MQIQEGAELCRTACADAHAETSAHKVEAETLAPKPYTLHPESYRGTSLIRNRRILAPYSRAMPRALR